MDESVRVGVDVGGTFTDVVLVADGEVTTTKVPTTEPESEGVIDGIEAACEAAAVDRTDVDGFRHATTVAVNALLENTVAEVALVTTAGFADVLEIGRQSRPALYDLDAHRPDPLVPSERRYEVDERATTDGIERPVEEDAVAELAADLDAEAVAVSFLHAYAHPGNEASAAAVLRNHLDVPVVASHEVLPAFREYERTATTVADAALAPVVATYLDGLAERTGATDLPEPRIMQANGGIATADVVRNRPVSTVMSGPAAGVVGASALGDPSVGRGGTRHAGKDDGTDRAGDDDGTDRADDDGTDRADDDGTDRVGNGGGTETEGVVTLDMGGTSTDVALVRDGDVEHTTAADVGGHPVRIPMVDVTTVGAGGGSIARVDAGGALRVGPDSAGADPGPACYGRGGRSPTLTDAALQLGYLGDGTAFGADIELDADAAANALAGLADDAGLGGPTAVARGVLAVAAATTARTIRQVTVERGHDPRDLTLAAFGGAGPMIAARLAERLDVGRVVVPPASGVLSAYGLLAADESQDVVRTVRRPLSAADANAISPAYDDLIDRAHERLTDPANATVSRRADLRYAGQSHELSVAVPHEWDRSTVRARFEDAHDRERGYTLPDGDVELVAVGVQATISGDSPTVTHQPSDAPDPIRREAYFDDWREIAVYDRETIPIDSPISGPAIVEGGESTLVCPPDWTLSIDDRGALHLARSAPARGERT